MARLRSILLALALCAAPSGLAGAAEGETAASPERGAEIAARWCAECHATEAAPRAADIAPTFRSIARSRSSDYLRGFLANPHARGLMPPFEISRQEIEDVIAYLQTLK